MDNPTNINPQAELSHRLRVLTAAEVLLDAARTLHLLDNGTLASEAITRLADLAQRQAYADYLALATDLSPEKG
jgi:hypothetical protein